MVDTTSVNTASRSCSRYMRRLVLRKGVAELLGRPGRRRMVGHGDVNDSSPLVREDDEHEQQLVGDCWHDEEIGSHDLADMVGQKSSPRL